MDDFNVEVSSLKHNFWQILNLSKQLLARNEVLKAKLKEQERSFEWKVTEMQKTIEDLKRKNNMLQKKLSTGEDSVSVVSKDYEEVVKVLENKVKNQAELKWSEKTQTSLKFSFNSGSLITMSLSSM